MRYKYLENALAIIQKVFPNTGFDFNNDIVLEHYNTLIYTVRTTKYTTLDKQKISDEQKADAIANDIIKQLISEIIK